MPAAPVIGAIAGVAGAGASLYGASQASGAAHDAASAQTAANNAAIGEQRHEFDVNQQNLQPWLQAGHTALGQQEALLGIGGTPDYAAYVQNNPDLLAAYQANGNGQDMAAWGQSHWNQSGMNELRSYTPYTGAQAQAITQLKGQPLYQSLMQNGTDSILANASATGGLRGGNTQTSLGRLGIDTLAQLYQSQFSNLGGISGQGAITGANMGALGNSSSANISNLLAANGGAQAGGIMSGAGFRGAGFTGAANTLSNTLGRLYSNGPFGGPGMSYQSGMDLSPMSTVSPYETSAPVAPSFSGLTPTPSPTLF